MKMDDDQLLRLLKAERDSASQYAWGSLAREREALHREFHQMGYGNEEDGRSQFVTSDTADTIEWILPSLLKIFVSSDNVVEFEPRSEEDVESAEQATSTCNYVFAKQNNGFMTLHTAFKDALMYRNCAVHWYVKEVTDTESQPYDNLSIEQIAMLLEDGGEIDQQREIPQPDGSVLYGVRIKKQVNRKQYCVEAFAPEELLIHRRHTTPLLDDCRYVARLMRVTVSELREMGFDVSADDMVDSEGIETSADRSLRRAQIGRGDEAYSTLRDDDTGDETTREGWLHYEYIIADYDGDGIAERRCVMRIGDKILSNEPCSMVPICTGSPILRQHRWDGLSMADMTSDLQRLHTTIIRQMLDGLYLANNPRTIVQTNGANGAPMANVDDLLDSRVGGVVREYQSGAVRPYETQWVGAQAFPMVEYVTGMRENRTGVTRYNQGLDANSLNKTATGVNAIMSASQQRIELIARVLAETIVKPIFKGIFKMLLENQLEPLSYRLNNKFVKINPQEWRDSFDLSLNVGLGTGNKDQMLMHLQSIAQAQATAVQAGGMGLLVTPKNIYNVQAKIAENAGFKNVGDFWNDPEGNPAPKDDGPPPEVQKEQMKIEAEQQKFQAEAQLEIMKADKEAELKLQLANIDRQTKIDIEQIKISRDADREMARAMSMPQQGNEDRLEAVLSDLQAGLQQVMQQQAQLAALLNPTQ